MRGFLYVPNMYKNIMSDNRVSFTTENLTTYMVVNSFLFKLIFQFRLFSITTNVNFWSCFIFDFLKQFCASMLFILF